MDIYGSKIYDIETLISYYKKTCRLHRVTFFLSTLLRHGLHITFNM